MNKDIKEVHDEMRTKKIVLAGEAGQGIRLMAQILAEILTRLQKYVTLNLVYGPSVRSGEVQAELLYCDKPISVPLVEDVDVLLLLSDADVSRYQAKEVIIEKSLCDTEKVACELKYPSSERVSFSKIATEEFGSSRFVNMVALGTLLRHIGVNIEKVNFQAKLPSRYIKENLEAIKYGYLHLDLSGTGTEK